jgi:uncharacterized protein (TIGR03000 family)
MRRVLAILIGTFCFSPSVFAQRVEFPDNSTSDHAGGLIFIRKGNQTTWSLGGVVLPRYVKVVTRTPEGNEYTRFKMPSMFRDPYAPPLSEMIPAMIQVQVPDPHALLFIDGDKIPTVGTSRQLESPALAQGKNYPLRLRAAYVAGNNFVIEDREIVIRAGGNSAVTFDGKGALVVPLPKEYARSK